MQVHDVTGTATLLLEDGLLCEAVQGYAMQLCIELTTSLDDWRPLLTKMVKLRA